MKTLSTLLLFLASYTLSFAGPQTYQSLLALNAQWAKQKDISAQALPAFGSASDKDWIRLHLALVEQTLRGRSTDHLSATQQAARMKSLDDLHGYWLAGNFPINDIIPGRRPIFIDKYDNFCAVGFLVKASGHEDVSRTIADKTNLAYVMDMRYPQLDAWAANHGFTKEELAWIQPSYGYVYAARPMGKGTDGVVHELCTSTDGNKLYVGGLFSKVDSSISAQNIAYVTKTGDSTFEWHSIGTGTNGTVRAIEVHNDTLFIGGDFTQAGGNPAQGVAFWDGANWQNAGCIAGQVYDLKSFEGKLYAAGNFDVCAALSEVNFARREGNIWLHAGPLEGHVNTMAVLYNSLILGGDITYANQHLNIIQYYPSTGFLPFNNHIKNEVLDIALFKDSIYASCRRTATLDSQLLQVLRSGSWVPSSRKPYGTYSINVSNDTVSYNTICDADGELYIGGSYRYTHGIGSPDWNCSNLYPKPNSSMAEPRFAIDSTINKMVMFKGELISGGAFTGNKPFWPVHNINLNGIARKVQVVFGVGVEEPTAATPSILYPNPATAGTEIHIASTLGATTFLLHDAAGRIVANVPLDANATTIKLPQVAAGVYTAELKNNRGESATQLLQIK